MLFCFFAVANAYGQYPPGISGFLAQRSLETEGIVFALNLRNRFFGGAVYFQFDNDSIPSLMLGEENEVDKSFSGFLFPRCPIFIAGREIA